jgi:hypothetical protein
MFPNKCEQCGLMLQAHEKGQPFRNENTLYTSLYSWRVLCGECIADECEATGRELPKSLRQINDERKRQAGK